MHPSKQDIDIVHDDELYLYSRQTSGQILLNIRIRSWEQFQREMCEVFKSVCLHNIKVWRTVVERRWSWRELQQEPEKKQFLQPIHIKERFMRYNIQIISHRGFSLSCSEMHCSSKSMNFCGNDVKSIKSPCCTFKLRRKANNDYYTENLTLSQILLCWQ